MAAETGVPAIKRLIISLLVIGAVACGAIYVVVSPPEPIIKRTANTPPARSLAYEQQITRPDDTGAAPGEGTSQKHAMAPADAVPAETAPAKPAPAQDAQAAAPAEDDARASEDGSSDMAGLPPDEGVEAADPDALPWQQRAGRRHQAAPGEGADSFDPMAGEDSNPSDMAAVPGEDADPNAWPAEPQEEPQEWVQVLVSGAGMHGTASEDAPALFSFPYGRTLRVVSRYEGWVEVTDPQSAATGWMKAQYLAPVAAPGSPGETEAMYDDDEYGDEPPRRRRGWWRRHGGGFGDMLNRALGGGY
jgi:hypothetical protein